MKRYIIFSIMLLCLFAFSVEAQIRLSSPIEKAVYQRNASGNANISFAGQVPQIPCGTGNFLRYSINRISLQNGSLNSAMSLFTTLPNDARGRFFLTSQLSTGWYSVTFETYFNNSLVFTNSYKFGVGMIAVKTKNKNLATQLSSFISRTYDNNWERGNFHGQSFMVNFYKDIRDTTNFLQTAESFCNYSLMSMSIDTMKKRDSRERSALVEHG